jgi:hypothetical protein
MIQRKRVRLLAENPKIVGVRVKMLGKWKSPRRRKKRIFPSTRTNRHLSEEVASHEPLEILKS